MKLRCYCCGEKLEGTIVLSNQSHNEVDRVFVVSEKCAKRLEDRATEVVHRNPERVE